MTIKTTSDPVELQGAYSSTTYWSRSNIAEMVFSMEKKTLNSDSRR